MDEPERDGAGDGLGDPAGDAEGDGAGVAPEAGGTGPPIPGTWGVSRPIGGRLPAPPPLKGAAPGGLLSTSPMAAAAAAAATAPAAPPAATARHGGRSPVFCEERRQICRSGVEVTPSAAMLAQGALL